ncbi:MAG: hypothetical protein DCC49_07475 [Acidobacteria bacterium]|nr:MAG: hypothetical protein DCC49_07475 [Acidobacteriota bacterium]
MVSWTWMLLSLLYLVLLTVASAFYAFAPPWSDDFRLLPPPGTTVLWAAIFVASFANLIRIGGAWALIAGERGRPAVKIGWCVMVSTILLPVVDFIVNFAEWIRGVPGRFTPIPIALVAIASLVVLCRPGTLRWVWTLGALHVPKLKYEGNFPRDQAMELGADPFDSQEDQPRTTGAPPIIPYKPGGRDK